MSWDNGAGGNWGDGGAALNEPAGVTNGNSYGGEESYGNGNGGEAFGGEGEGGGYQQQGGCFNCGEEGQVTSTVFQPIAKCFNSHSKRDCPNPAKPRPCYNCGEEG